VLRILKKLFATSLILAASADAYGAADYLDPTGMTQVMDGAEYDDATVHIHLGHNFPYFGHTFTDVWMSSNGFLMFYDPTVNVGNPNYNNSLCCNGLDLANMTEIGAFSYMMAPLWTDLIDKTIGDDSGYFYDTDNDGSSFLWYNVHEYYNDNTNTFQVDLYPDGSFDFIYDEVDVTEHATFIGFTGDVTSNANDLTTLQYEAQSIDEFGLNFIDQTFSGGRAWYGDDGGYGNIDCSDPLNDSSCSGYDDAYFDQQCTNNSLYDSQCPGYADAFYTQQCNSDPFYDNSCSGYDDAYFEQQCNYDQQYDFQCPGYIEEVFEDPTEIANEFESSPIDSGMDTGMDDGSTFNEFGIEEVDFSEPQMEDTLMMDEFAPMEEFNEPMEQQYEEPPVQQEQMMLVEEAFEETMPEIEEIFEPEPIVEEEIAILEDLEITEVFEEDIIEKPVAKTRKSGKKRDNSLAISVSVSMANNLVSNLEQTAISESASSENAVSSSDSASSSQSSNSSQSSSGSNSAGDGSSQGSFADNSNGSNSGASENAFSDIFSSDTALFINMTGETSSTASDGASDSDQTSIVTEDVGQNVALGDAAPIGFAIIPPTAPEMQVEVVQVKSLAERIADQVAASKRENSNEMAVGQTSLIKTLASGVDVSAYYNVEYSQGDQFYTSKDIYTGVIMRDNVRTHYNMFSKSYGTMNKLIRSQYE
tara:strand:- start:1606 stop:3708 length:2103 start_codon:yes stop_codon:yes gene_type:complete